MKILISPDSFKGSLKANEVAKTIASVFDNDLDVECRCMPLADGGEGSIDIIENHFDSEYVELEAYNAVGKPIVGYYLKRNTTAFIEIANVSGLHLLQPNVRNPIICSSYGTGQLIKHALDNKCNSIVLFLGGSATVDGGCGIVDAICGKPYQKHNPLFHFSTLDLDELKLQTKDIRFKLVTDVTNRIVGANGGAHVFGPQKGANKADVFRLEQAMIGWVNLLEEKLGIKLKSIDGLGAAGGAALPFVAIVNNSSVIKGYDFFDSLCNYTALIHWADVVITGEGCIDEQTEMGKGPGQIAKIANGAGKRVIGIGGLVKMKPFYFEQLFATSDRTLMEEELQLMAKNNLLAAAQKARIYLRD